MAEIKVSISIIVELKIIKLDIVKFIINIGILKIYMLRFVILSYEINLLQSLKNLLR